MRAARRIVRTEHAALVDDIVDGKRLVWLGSGISRDEVPDLVELLRKVLVFLRDQAHSGPDVRVHKAALYEILDDYLPGERGSYDADPVGWEPPELEGLREAYSRVLSVGVEGKSSDYLLIDGAGAPQLYGRSDLVPGTSHRLLAILIAEGVLLSIASGNWDGLVEAAVRELTGRADLLDVYVDADDAREGHGFAEIAKFHGCAVRALEKPERYRDKIIATRAQITRLDEATAFKHMQDHLRQRTSTLRSLILGLSVQDSDLLNLFAAAANAHPWPWDEARPAYVFAEPRVLATQRDVLQVVYGEEFNRERATVLQRSATGMYAAPLLAALVVEVLLVKLVTALRRSKLLSSTTLDSLEEGIERLGVRLVVAIRDETALIEFLTSAYADLLRTYFGSTTVGAHMQYVPFFRGTKAQLFGDMAPIALGVDCLAAVIGLLGWGDRNRRWRAVLIDTSVGTRLGMRNKRSTAGGVVAMVRGPSEADEVMAGSDWVTGVESMSICYLQEGPRAPQRSPSGGLGRGRTRATRRELAWHDIVDSTSDIAEIADRFATGVGL